jgi:hypothetical protein
MSEENQPGSQNNLEVEALGAKLKTSPDALARTIASIGTVVMLGAMMWWEATQGRPQIINTINEGWRAADKEHQERIDVIQKRADERLDRLVDRHAEAIQGLREAMLAPRKAVSSVDAPVAAPQQ